MNYAALLLATTAIAGCAAPGERQDGDQRPPGGRGRASVEELREYIDAVQPTPVATLRFKEPLRWTYINDYFVIIEARKGPHLVELAWECKDLRSSAGIYSDMADRREKRGILRVNIDTLRGCRIENFYKLPAVAAVEAQEDTPTEQEQR